MKISKTAFFGLGVMGLPMAERLLGAGIAVDGYDPDAARAERLTASGGHGYSTPPFEVDPEVDAVVTMLPSAAIVKEVVEAAMARVRKPVVFLDCSTIDVATTAALAKEASARGHAFIDAPVSGGFEMAAAGDLRFMVGGDANAVAQASPLFEAMGSRMVHFGPATSGQAVKACNNMVIGISMLALCEGFALAKKMDLDLGKVMDLWMNAGVRSWLLENRCPAPDLLPDVPSSHGYETGFASTLMVKDLEVAQQASRDAGMATPFGALALDRYKDFVGEGNGDLDFSAIYRTYIAS